MKPEEVREWIEGDRGLWHAVVRRQYGKTVFFITACGRTEVDGLVKSSPRKMCGKCRRALAALAALEPSTVLR